MKVRCTLEVVLPGGQKSTHVPNQWPFTLGRAADNTIAVPADRTMSNHHIKIYATSEGRLFVEDLGSTNGSKVNGKAIGTLPYMLKDGDEIRAGKTLLKVKLGGGKAVSKGGVLQRAIKATSRLLGGFARKETALPPGYVRCPSCSAKIHVGNRPASARVGCPKCRHVFVPEDRA